MVKAEVDNLDDKCVITLIFGDILANRFRRGHCFHSEKMVWSYDGLKN